jgi:outer membrane protein assembly factor BamB
MVGVALSALVATSCGWVGAMGSTDGYVLPGASALASDDAAVVPVADEPSRERRDYRIVAVEASGDERWTWEPEDRVVHGAVVAGTDVVAVPVVAPRDVQDVPGGLCLLESGDGAVRWCVDVSVPSWRDTGPFAPRVAVGDAAVGSYDRDGMLRAFDLTDGRERFAVQVTEVGDAGQTPPALVADGDGWLVSTAGRGGEGPTAVVAIDADGQERWRVEVAVPRVTEGGHGLAVDDDLVVVHGTREVVGLGRADGAERWRSTLPDPPALGHQGADAAPAIVGDTVVVLSEVGIDAEARVLYGLGRESGDLRWERTDPPPSAGDSSFVLRVGQAGLTPSDGRLVHAGEDLTVLDPTTGETLDRVDLDAGFAQTPAVTEGGQVAVIDGEQRLRWVDTSS